jgi:hypothetical protein
MVWRQEKVHFDRSNAITKIKSLTLLPKNIYNLMTSFDDGEISNWLTSCIGYKWSEL